MARKKKSSTLKATSQRHMLLVLGMHRSGTSALSGVLHAVGCDTPRTLMEATEPNPKGYFESHAVFRFNEDLLQAAASRWKDWRPIRPAWFNSSAAQTMQAQASELLTAEFGTAPLAVLKDPRICRMVPFWCEAAQKAGFNVLPVLTHRNPIEVAHSLSKRDGIEMAEGFIIWLHHVLSAEFATRKMKRFITSYDAVLNDWSEQITGMQDTFGVEFPDINKNTRGKIESFLSPDLRHFWEKPEDVDENEKIPDWVRTTYAIFEQWTKDGEDKSSYAALDRVRQEVDRATPVFRQILSIQTNNLNKSLTERTKQVETAHQRRQQDLKELDAEKALNRELRSRLKISHQEAQMTKTTQNQHRKEVAEFTRILDNRQAQIFQSAKANSELRTQLEERQSQLADVRVTLKALERQIEDHKEQISLLQSDKKELGVTLDQQREQIAKQSDRLTEETAAQAKLRKDLQTYRAQLEVQDTTHATFEETIKKQAAQITTLEREKTNLQDMLERKTAELLDKNMQFRGLKAEMVVVRSETSAKMAKYHTLQDTLQREVDYKDREIAAFEAELDTLKGSLSTTRSALVQRQLEAEETFERANAADERANAADERAKIAERAHELHWARIEELQGALDAMHNSTFWRMTKPFRMFVDVLRRIP